MKFLCKKLFTGEFFVLILFCEEIMADEAGESCGFCGSVQVSAARFRALPESAPLCAGRKAGVCRLRQTAARAAVQKAGGEQSLFRRGQSCPAPCNGGRDF